MKKYLNKQIILVAAALQLIVLLLTVLLLLSACNNSSVTVANGGVTGTGITMGRITNFGSVFVNGVRFDVDGAEFLRNDQPATQGQADFSVGEFVVIKGSIGADSSEGVAIQVAYSDALNGEITRASTDGQSLEVLGQLVHTDALTVFHGFTDLTELDAGNLLEVSGVLGTNGHIVATLIKKGALQFDSGVSRNRLRGRIANIDTDQQQFELGGLLIDYASADLLNYEGHEIHNDQYIEVASDTAVTNYQLTASTVKFINETHDLSDHHSANIEGLVNQFTSISNFQVNGLLVTTTPSTRYQNGNVNRITENAYLRLTGTIHESGVLVADRITFQVPQNVIEQEGMVQSVDLENSEVRILNRTIVVNTSTLMIDENNHSALPFTLADLHSGDRIKVSGIALNDGKLLAYRLEKKVLHHN